MEILVKGLLWGVIVTCSFGMAVSMNAVALLVWLSAGILLFMLHRNPSE